MKSVRKPSKSSTARLFAPRMAVLLFTLFAFTLQGLVTQIHIHGAKYTGETGIAGLLAKLSSGSELGGSAGETGKHGPKNDDAAKCPFCQATLHSGAFVSPSAAMLVPFQQTFSLVPLLLAIPLIVGTASHFWRGRAPPLA